METQDWTLKAPDPFAAESYVGSLQEGQNEQIRLPCPSSGPRELNWTLGSQKFQAGGPPPHFSENTTKVHKEDGTCPRSHRAFTPHPDP